MLQVNLIFLIMIIIVLVTKLRANNAVETVQVRKAIKATFILVPLLGISNLLFVANPNDNGFGEKVSHMTLVYFPSLDNKSITASFCVKHHMYTTHLTK